MKLLLLLLPFLFTQCNQANKEEKSHSININGYTFPTHILDFDNAVSTGYAKVFVVPIKSFDSLKSQITDLYHKRKQEYNVYYMMGIDEQASTIIVEQALTEYLNQIDSNRITRGGTTFLRQYSWNKENRKVTYLPIKKELKQVSNLYYLNSSKDLCKYMACSYR